MEKWKAKFTSHWKTIEKHPGPRILNSVGRFLSRAGLAASGSHSSTRRNQEGRLTILPGKARRLESGLASGSPQILPKGAIASGGTSSEDLKRNSGVACLLLSLVPSQLFQ